MGQLQIRLFGGLRITRDGETVPSPTPQRATLLGYLLIFTDRMHARSLLAGLFWGELPDTRARGNLNDAIYRLRLHLDPPGTPPAHSLIQTTATHVGLNPSANVGIDVQQFLHLVQPPATVEQQLAAIQLYSGELLPGVYDDWLLLERERLVTLYHQTLANLLAHYQAGGMIDTALDIAQRLVAADPLREDANRELMRLYYRAGRRDRAFGVYQTLRQRLLEELEIDPEPATTELYHTLQAGWSGGEETRGETGAGDSEANALVDVARRLRELPLLGRDPERRRLAEWLGTPRAMRTPMLLLEGETGVGKSRMAKDVADEAYRRGIFVLWGRYHEMAAPLPYGGLVEALRSGLRLGAPPPLAPIWLSEVSRLLPELVALQPDLPPPVSLPPDQERVRLWEALVQYLLALASTGPQMVIMEDVQWIDQSSLDLLQYLLPRLPGTGFRLLATLRTEELSDRQDLVKILETLESSDMLVRVTLRRLELDTVLEVVRYALNLDQHPVELGQRLWRETEGNAFFALETLRLWAERGLLARAADGTWHIQQAAPTAPDALPTPASVRRVLTQRLQRLGAAERTVLEVGAVLGDQVPETLLWRASGGGPEAVLAPAEELLQRHLWIEHAGGYAFAHNKVREVVYDSISGPRKRHLHRLAAAALEAEQPDNAESLAHHYSLAEEWGRALPCLLRAAQRALRSLASEQAITYYERAMYALDHVPPEGLPAAERMTQRYTILTERAWLYLTAGRLDAAQADYDTLLALAQHEGNAERQALAHTSRAKFLMEQGHYAAALAEAEQALQVLRPAAPEADPAAGRGVATTFDTISRIYTRMGNDAEARAAADQALERYRRLGDRAGEADTLTQYAALLGRQGDLAQAVALLQRTLGMARELGDRRLEGRVLNNLALYSSDPDESYDLLHRYLAISEEIGNLPAECMVRYNLAELTLRFGRYDEALAHAERAIMLATNLNDQHDLADAIITRGRVWQALGEYGRARAETLRGLGMLQTLGVPSSLWWGLLDLSRLMLDEGQWQGALANVEQSYKWWLKLDQPYGAGLAGLFYALQARARLGLRQHAQARVLAQQALATLGEDSAAQAAWVDPSIDVLAWCYKVLAATAPRAEADAVLERAHRRLETVAARCGPRLRRTYLEVVPECRAIRAAWTEYQAGHDKPAGESLARRESKVTTRQAQIRLLLQDAQQRGEGLTDEDLARILSVSLRTIQRDVAQLREDGRLA